MSRYVFSFPALQPDPAVVAEAQTTVKALGATVVRCIAGSMLLDAAPAVASKVAAAMPDWRLSEENCSYRAPERTPLQRARLAVNGRR
ncbi:hypothetical protein [Roseateles sp. LYH14W]|uniref:Uncharacterized protein n=1 Tax=Pelomonas parva TaxID=3299032 RepID=A0ABW7F9Z8_9BURK